MNGWVPVARWVDEWPSPVTEALLQQERQVRALENVPLHLAIRRALQPPSGESSPKG